MPVDMKPRELRHYLCSMSVTNFVVKKANQNKRTYVILLVLNG